MRRRHILSSNQGSPLQFLAGLSLYARSTEGVTIATGVSQWNDQSGAGNHLVQGVGAKQPVVTAGAVNGLPCITFDGVDDFMNVGFVLGQPETIFMVFRQVTWTLNDFIFDGATDLSRRLVQSATTPGLVASAGTSLAQDDDLAVNTFGLMTFIVNGASSEFQINNLAAKTGAIGAGVGNGITLGCRGSLAAAFANIGVAELAIKSGVASAGERASYRAYSQARYGVGA